LAATWAKGWNRWSHYRKQHGTPHVPENCRDLELVQWVKEQRINYSLWKQDESSTFLTKAAWDLLENMGFDFGSSSKSKKKRQSKTNKNDEDDPQSRSDASLSVKGSKTVTTEKSSPPKRKRVHNGETKHRSSKSKKKQVLTLKSSSDGLEKSDMDSHTESVTASSVEGTASSLEGA
jgi:hypothetical protein